MRRLKYNIKKFINFLMYLLFIIIIFFVLNIIDFIYSRDGVLSITVPNKIYLAVGETKEIDINIKYKERGNKEIKYEYDKNIIEFKDSIIYANSVGKTNIVISSIDKESSVEVIVTDLISLPRYAQNKDYLGCNIYSEEETILLDDILKNRIESVGYKTRAGVVEAARFLSLRFNYKINYFFENGRLANEDRKYIDGEGRYYHKGLYLNEFKYKDILASSKEPTLWGCDLYSRYVNTISSNGLNCSGFVSWVLLNGGFDIGDIGAGSTKYYDFTDVGEKINIDSTIKDKIKVGDLIGRDGHIAIIIGKDSNKLYIAESYIPSLKVREFTYDEIQYTEEFDYVMLMDTYYLNDGKLTNMW